MFAKRPKAPLNMTPSEDSFDGVLILIQKAHNFDHATMMRLRRHLLAVYQSQQVYDRKRKMWLIREGGATSGADGTIVPHVALVSLAHAARAWLGQGQTAEGVMSIAAAEFLRRCGE